MATFLLSKHEEAKLNTVQLAGNRLVSSRQPHGQCTLILKSHLTLLIFSSVSKIRKTSLIYSKAIAKGVSMRVLGASTAV